LGWIFYIDLANYFEARMLFLYVLGSDLDLDRGF
jgi:hypothetical protein